MCHLDNTKRRIDRSFSIYLLSFCDSLHEHELPQDDREIIEKRGEGIKIEIFPIHSKLSMPKASFWITSFQKQKLEQFSHHSAMRIGMHLVAVKQFNAKKAANNSK